MPLLFLTVKPRPVTIVAASSILLNDTSAIQLEWRNSPRLERTELTYHITLQKLGSNMVNCIDIYRCRIGNSFCVYAKPSGQIYIASVAEPV